MPTAVPEKTIRAGSFTSLAAADRAVQNLLDEGFTPEEITVICSDETRERHFREFQHQEPAGQHTGGAVVAGTSLGAALGGLAAIAIGAGTGNVPLIIAGATGISAGSAMGGFLGAMLTRGSEKEPANYYDQAMRNGDILVAVEVHGDEAPRRLASAARLIAEAGAHPLPLPEG